MRSRGRCSVEEGPSTGRGGPRYFRNTKNSTNCLKLRMSSFTFSPPLDKSMRPSGKPVFRAASLELTSLLLARKSYQLFYRAFYLESTTILFSKTVRI